MTEEKLNSGRFDQIEDDVSSLKGEVGSLKSEFKVLGSTVKGLSEDIAASDRKQESWHHETTRRQELFQKEWRDQKDAERREKEQWERSRQIGPLQALQIAATCAGILAAAFGGFFFLVKAYVDGSIAPQITQLTERQNGTTTSAVTRNEIIDRMRAESAEVRALLSETNRVALDNRTAILGQRDRLRDVEIEISRQDEREKAERVMREMADTAIREELRQFKARSAQ